MTIPKFKIEFEFEASKVLKEMGMKDGAILSFVSPNRGFSFSPSRPQIKPAFANADFSGISAQPLSIGQVFHKGLFFFPFSHLLRGYSHFCFLFLFLAFVDVNEEGTEAAAATAVVMLRSMALNGPSFHATRPFIFLIWDRLSGLVLFSGLVNNPVAK